jgi:hypothetical protein
MDTLFFNPAKLEHDDHPDHEVHSWSQVMTIL